MCVSPSPGCFCTYTQLLLCDLSQTPSPNQWNIKNRLYPAHWQTNKNVGYADTCTPAKRFQIYSSQQYTTQKIKNISFVRKRTREQDQQNMRLLRGMKYSESTTTHRTWGTLTEELQRGEMSISALLKRNAEARHCCKRWWRMDNGRHNTHYRTDNAGFGNTQATALPKQRGCVLFYLPTHWIHTWLYIDYMLRRNA